MKKPSNEELLVELEVPFPVGQVLWRVTSHTNLFRLRPLLWIGMISHTVDHEFGLYLIGEKSVGSNQRMSAFSSVFSVSSDLITS